MLFPNQVIRWTIHQPWFRQFNKFTMVYMLSKYGSCMYFDSPTQMVAILVSFSFDEAKNVNPVDYAIEIANGRFDIESFYSMSQRQGKIY